MKRQQLIWVGLLSVCSMIAVSAMATAADEEKPASGDEAKQAEKSEQKKPKVAGTWEWERSFGGNTVTNSITLKRKDGKLTGTMQSSMSDTDLELNNIKLEGNKLSFEVTREFGDRELDIHFEGEVKGDAIDGNVTVEFQGQQRELPWQAKRARKGGIIGTWQFKIETDDGQVFEPTLKVTRKDGELAGTYNSVSGEMPVKDIALKDGVLTFTVEGEANGSPFRVSYKGKPENGSIKGTVDYDLGGLTGTEEFEGKKVEKKEEAKAEEEDADSENSDSQPDSEN